MLVVYVPGASGLQSFPPAPGMPVSEEAVWIDLCQPVTAEVHRVEQALGLALPTREEMQEIEASSRLYQQDGAVFMTAVVLAHSDTGHPKTTAITFVLSGNRLVTVRHAEPRPFRSFAVRASRQEGFDSGRAILLGLLDTVIERAADILENEMIRVDAISSDVFDRTTATHARSADSAEERDFQDILRDVGKAGDVASRARESLMSISRLLAFLDQGLPGQTEDMRVQVKVMWRDVQSLLDHATFLAGKISFLLDATLGMVNIEQNSIIKIFSIVSVTFLPPTMIASIYGMNFRFMPELEWSLGYPWALLLMVMSAVLPLLYFVRKGWL